MKKNKIGKRNLEGMVFVVLNRVVRELLVDKVKEVGNEPHRYGVGLEFGVFLEKGRASPKSPWQEGTWYLLGTVRKPVSLEQSEPGAEG